MKKDNGNHRKNGRAILYWLLSLTLIFLAVNVVFAMSLLSITSDFNNLKETTEQQNSMYETEIKNLQQKVALLAEHVTQENESKSLEEAKKNPIGIPVSGKATIISEPEEDGENALLTQGGSSQNGNSSDANNPATFEDTLINPYTLEISLEKGTKIIATGNGVVSEVSKDDTYGYLVKIDHQNGYVSVYRYSEEPKIKQDDEVLKGQMIYEVTQRKGTLAYHILYENTYINPFDLIEISG
ncbi:MAG: M23 family metallopeptidase [Lachnospiraceae bacterium]|nr:M23 family metallopeptidase [Lachnospiraceae bacterium]